MRTRLAILSLLTLAFLPAAASARAHHGVSVHVKRVGHRQMTLSGRAPAYSQVVVTLLGAHGRFLVEVSFNASRRGRYSACVVAPRRAFRAIAEAEVRGKAVRKRSRLIPARRPTKRPGCLPPQA